MASRNRKEVQELRGGNLDFRTFAALQGEKNRTAPARLRPAERIEHNVYESMEIVVGSRGWLAPKESGVNIGQAGNQALPPYIGRTSDLSLGQAQRCERTTKYFMDLEK